MSTQDTGGPAFPTPRYERGDMYSLGMTLRDYFAAKAMQGILFEGLDPEQTAKHAYDMADAMLKARSE
jgi:predicted RNA polymerase sigma factor